MNLVIEDEGGTRSIVPFTGDVIVVGRGAEDVTFRLSDRNVSRRHARFVRQSGTIFVEDLGSLTGTRVNGERIASRRKLRAGDLVQIGDYDLAILAEGTALEPGAPPPLPSQPRTSPGTPSVNAPSAAPEPAPPSPSPSPALVARPGLTSGVGRTIAVGALALVLGVAAGWTVGTLSARTPSSSARR